MLLTDIKILRIKSSSLNLKNKTKKKQNKKKTSLDEKQQFESPATVLIDIETLRIKMNSLDKKQQFGSPATL